MPKLVILACIAALLLPTAALAHDIPADATIQAFFKPSGQQLNLIVRAPLKSMLDIEFPKRGPGFLDLARIDASLHDAAIVWIAQQIEINEGDKKLPAPKILSVRASLPSDRSFASYEEATTHLTSPPLPGVTDLYWDQALIDVWLEYPIQSDRSEFSIHPGLARLGIRVVTVLRFLPPTGVVRAFEFLGDPGLVRLDPRWSQAALRFIELGFEHILEGTDHLLFLLCLVIPFRRLRTLIAVVTAFTAAHSVTLIASAYNFGPDALWFPPLIETGIAISIVYMALENIVGSNVQRRWMISFGFGLVHGFGFSFALRQSLQFAGSHLLTSLLSFNIGVELGQLLVLILLIPVLNVVFRRVVAERLGTIILSAIVAHTGWHWMLERADRLRQFPWPTFDAALVAGLLRLLMLFVIAVGVLWLARGVIRYRAARSPLIKNSHQL